MSTPYTGEAHARGVATARPLKRGEVVDASPTLFFDAAAYRAHVKHTLLDHYVFVDRASGGVLLALGAGSLFNHSRTPNVDFRVDAAAATIVFSAARDVNAGEELTISYGVPWWEEEGEGEEEGGRVRPTHDHMDDEAAFLGAIGL